MKKIIKVSLLLSLTLLFGCQSNTDNTSPTNNNDNMIQVKNASPNDHESFDNSEIATHLSNIAGSIPDVNDAASIVAGPYAIVGINVNEDLDRQRVGTVKYSVTEALRNDPYGKTAIVIADADMMERIRGIGEEVQNGRPIRGIVDELAEIVNRYMPDLPVEEDHHKTEDQLEDKNNEQLKQIQEEQSNQKK